MPVTLQNNLVERCTLSLYNGWDYDSGGVNHITIPLAANLYNNLFRRGALTLTYEDRWATIGLVAWSVLYVVYTVREEETIRIISARKAVSHEQKQYRKANP